MGRLMTDKDGASYDGQRWNVTLLTKMGMAEKDRASHD